MDGIQPYVATSRPPAVASTVADLSAVKAPSDYVRAVVRKIWLVLVVAVPISVAVTIWAVRQPPVFQASAQITIVPPEYDPMLAALVSKEVGRGDPSASEKYLPNRVAQLKSKSLIERVLNDPSFLQGAPPSDGDAVEEFLRNLTTKHLVGTNHVNVFLEGNDAARTARQLRILLETFEADARLESSKVNEDIAEYAKQNLDGLLRELTELERKNLEMLKVSTTIGPGGKNIIQTQYETLNLALLQKRSRLDDFQQQSFLAQVSPKARAQFEDPSIPGMMSELHRERRRLEEKLENGRRVMRSNFDNDPSSKFWAGKLERVLDELNALQSLPKTVSVDPSESFIATMRDEIKSLERTADSLLAQHRASLADHELYLQRQEEREMKIKQIYDLKNKVQSFKLLSSSQKPPVAVLGSVSEPIVPIRPRRAMNIAIGVFLSLALGIGLVCLLEHLDHSVKIPEHLSVGLTLPLLGVIPRIRRTALFQRGGHLWTPGAPESVEADSYRNLRASLLGASDRLGPIVSLLVTSAKAGEGKSTTALNLAATCARAGERTLLMDVDLRRPSLGDVFSDGDSKTGLTDVLRGLLPWQRTVVQTDTPNLDYLPTGNARDIPIEILGTLELRQLLIGLSNHYDRVILDGPAVLGMADCRMLGRIVDAAVLVVRSGSHELRPLQRAKAMLEQSHVVLAGVVFNGLKEDFQNWSSYGPYTPYGIDGFDSRYSGRAGSLEAPTVDPSALVMAGSLSA
jgi:capsular exopolysaccharide synthesis family protein